MLARVFDLLSMSPVMLGTTAVSVVCGSYLLIHVSNSDISKNTYNTGFPEEQGAEQINFEPGYSDVQQYEQNTYGTDSRASRGSPISRSISDTSGKLPLNNKLPLDNVNTEESSHTTQYEDSEDQWSPARRQQLQFNYSGSRTNSSNNITIGTDNSVQSVNNSTAVVNDVSEPLTKPDPAVPGDKAETNTEQESCPVVAHDVYNTYELQITHHEKQLVRCTKPAGQCSYCDCIIETYKKGDLKDTVYMNNCTG